ncbi:MAG: cyclic nucleotide-binding domain-containing protein [Ardenticatenaceae bacterium]
MLTTVEKVIFLKQVSFFQEMTINQLRTLASISEEVSYEEGEQILAQGEDADALHVVVSGRVAIQRQVKRRDKLSIIRLTTLRPRDYFAEMSIFDNQPYGADAVALEATSLLLVRQRPLVALIKHQPELSLSLLKVLSQRLRHANDLIASKSGSKPKALVDLYDKGSIHQLADL